MGIQITLALRYLRGRRLRAALTTLAVAFGVFVIFGMNILVPTMLEAFQSTMMVASSEVDLTATLKSGGAFPSSALDAVKAVPGIRAAHGVMARLVNLPANFFDNDPAVQDRVSVLTLMGLDPEQARGVRTYPVREGRFLQEADAGAAVITSSLAETLGLRLGGVITLPSAQGTAALTIVGIRPPRALPGNEEVLVTLREAQRVLEAPERLTVIEANIDTTASPARRAEVQKAVETVLGPAFTLDALSSTSNMAAILGASTVAFNAFGVLALFMGAFIIFNTFRTIVAERRRDIGMLRAIGASRRTVIGAILAEGLIQGVIGTAAGMLLGYLAAWAGVAGIGPVMDKFVRLRLGAPPVSPGICVVSVVVGVGVTLAAGLIPAVSAGRVTPMTVLRPPADGAGYRRSLGAGGIVGLAMIAAALASLVSSSVGLIALGAVLFMTGLILVAPALVRPLAVAFGSLFALALARDGTGTVAQSNLTRQPSRAAVTASTTMIALALIMALGSLTSSVSQGFIGILKRSIGSDYIFMPPSVGVWQNNVGASAGLTDRLRAIPGVQYVNTWRYGAAVTSLKLKMTKGAPSAADTALTLLGVDPAVFPKVSGLTFSEGSADAAMAKLASGRFMVANPIVAAQMGVKTGDVVPFQTPQGTLEYTVVGVATDFLDAKLATAFISQESLARDFGVKDDMMIQVNLAPGADEKAVSAAVEEAGKSYPQLAFLKGKAYVDDMVGILNKAFIGLYVLFAFIALPSLLTTLNTLAISVLERTREIGMLRAVGTTRRQVRRIILTEALLLAAFGTAFGLAAGLYLGWLLIKAIVAMGFPLLYFTPGIGLVLAAVVGLLVGALAAIVPSRKAASLQIVAALRYE
jgi:putative ABC transport system permease protein